MFFSVFPCPTGIESKDWDIHFGYVGYITDRIWVETQLGKNLLSPLFCPVCGRHEDMRQKVNQCELANVMNAYD